MPSDDEIIIIENGDRLTWIKVYVNNSEPKEVFEALSDIAAHSMGHISYLNKLRLFRILWKILH